MSIHCIGVEQYFTVVRFSSQFYPLCNVVKFVNIGFGIVSSESVHEFRRRFQPFQFHKL